MLATRQEEEHERIRSRIKKCRERRDNGKERRNKTNRENTKEKDVDGVYVTWMRQEAEEEKRKSTREKR